MCSKIMFVFVRSLVQFFLLTMLFIIVDFFIQPKTAQEVSSSAIMGGVLLVMLSLLPYLYQRLSCQIKELNPLSYMKTSPCRAGALLKILLLGALFFLSFAFIILIEYFTTFEYKTFSAFLGFLMFGSVFTLPYYNYCKIKEIETNAHREPIKFFGKKFKARPKCPNCGSSSIEKREDHYVCAHCKSILDIFD